ncbi:dienelactone hydrolase family protein [Kurthia gibsonii]|uniref:dienelactone hydrolase family protein n=1 Tax=Kurthia gibsonii TaxID=33946 RepID=UPI001144F8EB|nr:dienelactone hydrolase family protein [Kurthia gibsonii]
MQLVGFSVGATVAWLCSEHPAVQKVLCFYGSRIRSYTNVIPKVPVQMVFGKNEKAFSPENVRIGLNEYTLVTFEIVEGAHGFANLYNQMYREQTTKRVLQQWFDLK